MLEKIRNDAVGGKLSPGEIQEIELGVGAFEPTLNVQLWKNYEDEMEIYLENPAGERVGPLFETLGAQRWQAGNTELLIEQNRCAMACQGCGAVLFLLKKQWNYFP